MRAGAEVPRPRRVPEDIGASLRRLQDKAFDEGFDAGLEFAREASLAIMFACTVGGAVLGGVVTFLVMA